MKRAIAEKIGVAAMFVLVIVVFSLAERDTQMLIKLHSKTAKKAVVKQELTTAQNSATFSSNLAARN